MGSAHAYPLKTGYEIGDQLVSCQIYFNLYYKHSHKCFIRDNFFIIIFFISRIVFSLTFSKFPFLKFWRIKLAMHFLSSVCSSSLNLLFVDVSFSIISIADGNKHSFPTFSSNDGAVFDNRPDTL